jgi:predicted PurR-regulated permease PerM
MGKDANRWFLLALAGGALYLCYLISKPFLGPVFASMVLAIVFYPLHKRIDSSTRRPNLAATISTVVVIVVVAIPAVVLSVAVIRELNNLFHSLSDKGAVQGGLSSYLMNLLETPLRVLERYVDLSGVDLRAAALRRIDEAGNYLVNAGVRATGDVFSLIIGIVAVFFTLFFLFRDGPMILGRIAEVLPLTTQQASKLATGVKETIVASVYGAIAVGLAQGSLTGLAFWVLGLELPVLWGMVTAAASLLPVVGTGLVWVPAAIVLAVSGHWIKALLLLAWGGAVVAQIDTLVRPYVVSGRTRLNSLMIFFALLGGVKAFGLMGLFIGPMVVSVTTAVLDMLKEANASHPESEPKEQVATAIE